MTDHVVICGHSRAGTTLLHEVMRQAWQGSGWQFYDEERPFEAVGQGARKVVTKRPLDVFKHRALREYADRVNLLVLLCVRDPRSLLTSKHAAVPGDYFYHADAQYQIGDGSARLINPGLLAVHDALMALHNDPAIKTEVVNYEDTLEEHYRPGSTPPALAAALNGDREIDRSRVDAWRDHWPRLVDQFTRYPRLFEVMRAYGYSLKNFEGVGGMPEAPTNLEGVGV